ncbi:MAG: deoxynucleoside kinase [Lachnospiraceae bacterium]|jgi:deoxyguanosine kinase|nr:deoxynucleoside kinase [Lachnospiraceae bacterium]
MQQGRIEICGGIASGKTTLARIMEKEGFCAVYERYQDNPFLGEFYKNKGVDCSFETEMVFTLLHYKMLRAISENKQLVSDYSLLQDLAYGKANLKKEEFAVFYQMYQYLMQQIALPRMIIYLKCRTKVLAERIADRAREMEQMVDIDYLSESILALEACLEGTSRVLVIESDRVDFINKDRDETVRKIKNFYFMG